MRLGELPGEVVTAPLGVVVLSSSRFPARKRSVNDSDLFAKKWVCFFHSNS